MATVTAPNFSRPVSIENGIVKDLDEDLFGSSTPAKHDGRRTSHRYSAFNTHLFSNYHSDDSPATAKRALEAHLSETDRRLEETSKLGTALVQQRKDLADRLKDVQQQPDGADIGPDLRQRLTEVEKEYQELGRESARAFLSYKSRSSNAGDAQFSNVSMEFKVKMAYHCSTYLLSDVSRAPQVQPNFLRKQQTRPLKSASHPASSATNPPIESMISSLSRRLAPRFFLKSANCKQCLQKEMTL